STADKGHPCVKQITGTNQFHRRHDEQTYTAHTTATCCIRKPASQLASDVNARTVDRSEAPKSVVRDIPCSWSLGIDRRKPLPSPPPASVVNYFNLIILLIESA
uniref:Uncharacterized protein n=1 Tax=Ciona intestinalis TaxID=7719 RepID=F6XMI8_CIOIN